MNLIEYPDREMMMIDLASSSRASSAASLRSNERASLAVPGGATPGPMLDALCAADIDWSRVHVLLTDERWVPEDAPRSNTRLVRERLLVGRAAAATLVPMHIEGMEAEAAIPALIEAVQPHLPLSVLLLGMGADGQTASLIPGADRLDEAMAPDAPPVMALTAPGAPEPRVTLTLPVLQQRDVDAYPDRRPGEARGAGAGARTSSPRRRRWRRSCRRRRCTGRRGRADGDWRRG